MPASTRLITERPLAVLAVLAAIVALATGIAWNTGANQFGLAIDAPPGGLISDDDPMRVFHERAREKFGLDRSVVVALPSNDAFGAQQLERIARMTTELEQLPHVSHVVSLTTAISPRGDDPEPGATASRHPDLADPAQRARLRRDIVGDPVYRGTLVSGDETVSSLIVYFDEISEREFAERRIGAQIYDIVERISDGDETWISGARVIDAAIAENTRDDLRFSVLTIAALVATGLLIAFRSLRAIALPLLSVGSALACTLALPAAMGMSLNPVTALAAPLVLALGFAYSMHVISEYYTIVHNDPEATAPAIVDEVLARVGLPLILSASTTALCVAALSLHSLTAMRQFSMLATVGVLFSVFFVLTLIPAALALLRVPSHAHDAGGVTFHRAAQRLIAFDVRYRREIIVAALVALALAVAGSMRMEVGTSYAGTLDSESRARSDFASINSTFGGANNIYIVIDAERDGTFVEPENLVTIAALQGWLANQPRVAGSTSVVDHLKLINRASNAGDPDYYRIPEDRALIKQFLSHDGANGIASYVDKNYRSANVLVRIDADDTRDLSMFFEQLNQRLESLPPGMDARVTGALALAKRTVDELPRGQLLSIVVALLGALAVLALTFASLRTGLFALFPGLVPVAACFGAIGLSGITLNPTTSLVACIALAITVDGTIHFMVRFNTEARGTGREGTAVQRALASVIRPLSYSTIALILGFLVLTAGDLPDQVRFGALAAFVTALAWLVNVTLTPSLSSGLRIVTLWDLLRLDLGPQPQTSIPMLAGLTLRQARIFALMADVSRHHAGSTLITEGDETTDEMFVVIDGELEAWVQREGERVVLSRMRRGTTFGEAGVFGTRRSASVSVVSRTRLLRFTTDDLERLEARFPRIAAIVYRNLNRLQAERAARDTQRVR